MPKIKLNKKDQLLLLVLLLIPFYHFLSMMHKGSVYDALKKTVKASYSTTIPRPSADALVYVKGHTVKAHYTSKGVFVQSHYVRAYSYVRHTATTVKTTVRASANTVKASTTIPKTTVKASGPGVNANAPTTSATTVSASATITTVKEPNRTIKLYSTSHNASKSYYSSYNNEVSYDTSNAKTVPTFTGKDGQNNVDNVKAYFPSQTKNETDPTTMTKNYNSNNDWLSLSRPK